MRAAQVMAHHVDSVRMLIIVIAAGLTVFWRPVLRIAISLIAITVTALLVTGAYVIMRGLP